MRSQAGLLTGHVLGSGLAVTNAKQPSWKDWFQ